MPYAALVALITTCASSMHGAQYVADPTSMPVLRGYVNACAKAANGLETRKSMNAERDFRRREILALMLDREVTLSYAGMSDALTALPAARAELHDLGELLKTATDQTDISAFEQQAELVGGQIQSLEHAIVAKKERRT